MVATRRVGSAAGSAVATAVVATAVVATAWVATAWVAMAVAMAVATVPRPLATLPSPWSPRARPRPSEPTTLLLWPLVRNARPALIDMHRHDCQCLPCDCMPLYPGIGGGKHGGGGHGIGGLQLPPLPFGKHGKHGNKHGAAVVVAAPLVEAVAVRLHTL